jgi:hypothetical protein
VLDPDDEPMPTMRQLHDLADKRMYVAKRRGGGVQMDLDAQGGGTMYFGRDRREGDEVGDA